MGPPPSVARFAAAEPVCPGHPVSGAYGPSAVHGQPRPAHGGLRPRGQDAPVVG